MNLLLILKFLFGPVLEGSGHRKGFQKVGEAYSKILAKDELERWSGRWFSGKLDLGDQFGLCLGQKSGPGV